MSLVAVVAALVPLLVKRKLEHDKKAWPEEPWGTTNEHVHEARADPHACFRHRCPVTRIVLRHGSRLGWSRVFIIDDDPSERWLSVCFYGEMITDPDEAGDLIPEGLLGEDGYCFDLYEYDPDEVAYLKQRLSQARENAKE